MKVVFALLFVMCVCHAEAGDTMTEDTVLRVLLDALLNDADNQPQIKKDTLLEPAINSWKSEFQARWYLQDADLMADMFTEDCIFIHSTGIYRGRKSVSELHQLMFDEGKRSVEGEVLKEGDAGSLGPAYDYAVATNHYFDAQGQSAGDTSILAIQKRMEDGTFQVFLKMEMDA